MKRPQKPSAELSSSSNTNECSPQKSWEIYPKFRHFRTFLLICKSTEHEIIDVIYRWDEELIAHSLSQSYEYCYGCRRLKILSHSYLFINSRHTQKFSSKKY